MTDLEIITTLAAANPLPREAAERADLNAAERELLEELRALPAPEPRALIRPRRRPRVRRIALAAAVATAAVAVLVVLVSGPRDAGGPAPAYAAELVRFANASPLVLLDAPGWHVVYADEGSARLGELRYVRGAADREGLPKGFSPRAPATLAGRALEPRVAPEQHVPRAHPRPGRIGIDPHHGAGARHDCAGIRIQGRRLHGIDRAVGVRRTRHAVRRAGS